MSEVLSYSHQEIARDRHADLLREATQERLAARIREGDPGPAVPARTWALRTAAALMRLVAWRPAAHAA